MTDWRNRITRYGTQPADQFVANPRNPRKHPQKQRDAVAGSLNTLGWIAPVVVNARTGYVIDGHERIFQALVDNADVPFVEVDLSEDEEALALASFDWITYLAEYDRDILDDLLHEVNTDDAALQAVIAELAESVAIPGSNDWAAAFGGLPDGDRAPFQQMTFTLHDVQAEQVNRAIRLAQTMGDFVDSPNQNSNGNALSRICELFITDYGNR